MSDYFDRFEQSMELAIERRAPRRRPARRADEAGRGHRRPLLAALAACAVLAPATLAVGWQPWASAAPRPPVCSADARFAAHASLVDAELPRWVTVTSS